MEQDTPREFEESAPSKADVERIETPIDGEVDQALRTPIPDDSDSDLDSLLSSDDEVLMEVETPIEPPTMAHDSMVTVRLSEPPLLTIDTDLANVASPKIDTEIEVQEVLAGKDGDNNNHNNNDDADDNTDDADSIAAATTIRDSSTTISNISVLVPDEQQDSTTTSSQNEEDNNDTGIDNDNDHDTSVDSSDSDTESERVNWDKLEQTEDEQTKDEDTDNSTALLLARLDEENAKLATNPKSVKVPTVQQLSSNASKPRPPSMAQLRQMVDEPCPSILRYSLVPPPPMTDLEFYAALVKDYQQTAARLPTLLSNKIRKGIPPPLRGVVWQSMSGARDAELEAQYERFNGETSPYEVIISKDLGRSFPGVEMFRDPEGDGQRMLGGVLKAFSLHDAKIGYCQGLAFLVGPLLMHMPDKQAFCVLVRLMEQYDLRSCFLPDLSGLHVRIYQFRELLKLNMPVLAGHLEALQVDPAYVSQWFLSFFAVTCPLPMLFRIYDVIFAEGATETLMRVALALMRKNEARLMSCPELEDVMTLLLSRGLWSCYGYNADEFVQDLVSLTSEVSREKLSQLEQGYRESLLATTANAARRSDITTAASRFLGRIWATSPKTATSSNLSPSPGGAGGVARSSSTLRRTTSKQSLTSTLNSIEGTSASIAGSTSTDATRISRDSSGTEGDSPSRESTPVGSGTKSMASTKTTDDKYLHCQIEDLLTALTELQRNNALLSDQLQMEREDRDEDKKAVQSLLEGLRRRAYKDTTTLDDQAAENTETFGKEDDTASALESSDEADETVVEDTGFITDDDDKSSHTRYTESTLDNESIAETTASTQIETPSTEDLGELLDRVESRFSIKKPKRPSSIFQTKAQLRHELIDTRERLTTAVSQSQQMMRRATDLEQESGQLREQLRESHSHVRVLHQDKQRLEKQMHVFKARGSACSALEPLTSPGLSPGPSSTISNGKEPDAETIAKSALSSGGLRELKLGRSRSTPSAVNNAFTKRMSSLPKGGGAEAAMAGLTSLTPLTTPPPPTENEALLLELVQAKTAEAAAQQEAAEARQKLEAFKKLHGITAAVAASSSSPSSGGGDGQLPMSASSSAVTSPGTAKSVFGRLTGSTSGIVGSYSSNNNNNSNSNTTTPVSPPEVAGGDGKEKTAAPAATTSGGFWGWRR